VRQRTRWVVVAACALAGSVLAVPAAQAAPDIKVAGGNTSTCAVLSTGGVDCWGDDSLGALGDGGACGLSCAAPVPVSGIDSATTVASGRDFACAVLATGGVDCWGDNGFGQLGVGNTTSSSTPVAVAGITNAVGIGAGYYVACALLATHAVECWGQGGFGALGDGHKKDSHTPVRVTGISNATEITASLYNTCALLSTHHVKCWGDNSQGQLGIGLPGSLKPDSLTPVTVSKLGNATGLATGWRGACAILATTQLDCWGDNADGQLGTGDDKSRTVPVAVPGLTGVTAVASNGEKTCALIAPGAVDCWGDNFFGELGTGSSLASVPNPAPVVGINDATAIGAGSAHGCAVLSSGGLDCWGDNDSGQLGDGSSESSSTPVPVAGIP
jgi:alpha-tubulin suppressor-like RCC1 family protein